MDERKNLIAIALILFGTLIFLSNYVPIFQLKIIWPILLIIIGLGVMFKDFH